MISVIVSIYKNLKNLQLILQGLEQQSFKDFEVIVSEDNDAQETVNFLSESSSCFSFPIKHVSQKDIGFRKTRVLNKALRVSEGEYLVFLDGDCVPHKHLLREYTKYLKSKTVCMGRRCYLDKDLTSSILDRAAFKGVSFWQLLFHSKRMSLGLCMPFLSPSKPNPKRLILGCNWGVDRQSLIEINGFDEDYIIPGVGEDHDPDSRLRKYGANFINIKHSAVCYHLYHSANYDQQQRKRVNEQWEEKKKEGLIACKNGLVKWN